MLNKKLKEARGLVLTGYHGDSELLKTAEAVSIIATDIYAKMGEKHRATETREGKGKRRGQG